MTSETPTARLFREAAEQLERINDARPAGYPKRVLALIRNGAVVETRRMTMAEVVRSVEREEREMGRVG